MKGSVHKRALGSQSIPSDDGGADSCPWVSCHSCGLLNLNLAVQAGKPKKWTGLPQILSQVDLELEAKSPVLVMQRTSGARGPPVTA